MEGAAKYIEGGSQEAGEQKYKTGAKVRCLDEEKRQVVEWTIVDYETPNKILHLKRDLPNGDIRMRTIHTDRLKNEQVETACKQAAT